MKKILIVGAMALLMLCPAKAQIAWQQVEPGVWKGVVGTPEEYSLLGVAGVTPQKEGFARLPEVTLPQLANEIVGSIQDGKTSLRIPLQRKEQFVRLWTELPDGTPAWQDSEPACRPLRWT